MFMMNSVSITLTFDMKDAKKAQPFGHPLDGRVRRLWWYEW